MANGSLLLLAFLINHILCLIIYCSDCAYTSDYDCTINITKRIAMNSKVNTRDCNNLSIHFGDYLECYMTKCHCSVDGNSNLYATDDSDQYCQMIQNTTHQMRIANDRICDNSISTFQELTKSSMLHLTS